MGWVGVDADFAVGRAKHVVGSLEGEEGRKICENVGSEIYCKDRFAFVKGIEGVEQKEIM